MQRDLLTDQELISFYLFTRIKNEVSKTFVFFQATCWYEEKLIQTNNKQAEKQAEGAQNDQQSALKETEQDYGLWVKHVAQWPTMHEIRIEALAMEQEKKKREAIV